MSHRDIERLEAVCEVAQGALEDAFEHIEIYISPELNSDGQWVADGWVNVEFQVRDALTSQQILDQIGETLARACKKLGV